MQLHTPEHFISLKLSSGIHEATLKVMQEPMSVLIVFRDNDKIHHLHFYLFYT